MVVAMVVAMAVVVTVVVTLAAGVVALLSLGLVVVTLAALTCALALWLSVDLYLAESLNEGLVVGLSRVERYGNCLSIYIYLNILDALLIRDCVVHLFSATSAVDVGHKYGCCGNLLVALLRLLSLSIAKAYKCH